MQCLNDFIESNSARFTDSPCTEITNVKNCVDLAFQIGILCAGIKDHRGIRVYFKFICGRRQF